MLYAFAPKGDTSQGIPQLDVVVGITSFGEQDVGCGNSQKPGVYTRVSEFLDWVSQETSGAIPQAPDPGVVSLAEDSGAISEAADLPVFAPFPALSEEPALPPEALPPEDLETLPSAPNPAPVSPQEQKELDKVDCHIHESRHQTHEHLPF